MAFDPNSGFMQPNGNDPSGFMPDFLTPNQIAAQREWANTLRKGALDASVGAPVRGIQAASPLSPLVSAVKGAYGGYEMAKAGKAEQDRQNVPWKQFLTEPVPGDPGQAYGGYAPGDGGGVSPAAGGEVPWQSPQAIHTAMMIESGGNPNARTGSYSGLFQLGPAEAQKYGGTDFNAGVRAWTDTGNQLRGILGREPTGAEVYLAHQQGLGGFQAHTRNPDAPAWMNMASTEEGRQKGPGWALQAIRGNLPDSLKPLAQNMTSRQFMEVWRQRFNAGHFGGEPGGPQPAGPTPDVGTPQAPLNQFAGPGAPPDVDTGGGQAPMAFAQNNAPASMSAALRGGGQLPAGQPGLPQAAPAGPQGAPPPGFFTQRQRISPETLYRMQTGSVDPLMREQMLNQYQSQFAPVQMQAPFGGSYVQDAQGRTMYVPGDIQKQHIKAGRVEIERPYWVDPSGTQHMIGGGAGPVTQGSKVPGTDVPPGRGGYDLGGPNGLGKKAAPPKPQSEAEPQAAPNQVAALETGTATDAPAPGILGTPPPTAGPALANKPPQVAQAGGGSFSNMTDQELSNYDMKQQALEKLQDKDVEAYTKNFQKYQDGLQTADAALPQINLLGKILQDPELISGPWSGVKQAWNDVFTGTTGNANATTRTNLSQTVQKLISGGILGQMRAQLEGLGQIRLAEIMLLAQSTAAQTNTPAANAAIMFLAQRAAQRLHDIGTLTGDYADGARWDKNGKRTEDNSDEAPTNRGMQAAIRTYLNKNPTATDAELDDIEASLKAVPHHRKNVTSSSGLPPGLTVKGQ